MPISGTDKLKVSVFPFGSSMCMHPDSHDGSRSAIDNAACKHCSQVSSLGLDELSVTLIAPPQPTNEASTKKLDECLDEC